ncbi:MAG: double zinc ribbon domain-containing protein, partial [Defluviitaleaceae bacterium]|nr:double zinc ribbon domain-containing protein [Defluviitaleaceae bacterium]
MLDWIFPPTCVVCKKILPLNENERFFCVECKKKFGGILISPPSCERCGANAQGTQEKNLHESESRSALKNEKNLHESES